MKFSIFAELIKFSVFAELMMFPFPAPLAHLTPFSVFRVPSPVFQFCAVFDPRRKEIGKGFWSPVPGRRVSGRTDEVFRFAELITFSVLPN